MIGPVTTEEWYVLLSGYGTVWTAVAAILGRLDALTELTTDMRTTPDELRRLKKFHEVTPAIGDSLTIVGHFGPKGERLPDRRLVRVRGPAL